LSVTQVETWMRDPYAIYARKILDLEALDPLDADPGAADYGTVIHDILDRFVRAYPEALPENAQDILYAFGQEHFAELLRRPGPRAFWWPKFLRIADWFLALEAERRPLLAQSVTETWGYLTLDGHAGPFRIKAKADRIDRHKTGRITLIDYKTGATPTETEVAAGFAPQLPLEAAMARAGGFDGIAPGPLESLEYWKLMGRDVAGKRTLLKGDPEALADQALEGVGGLIRAFDDPATPYEARPRPDAAPRYSDYEHLARIAEWATAEDTQ
ncbi:MAG: PD-(D/E)XK nuclease family protein, partial [Magnetospiraceae bacterium]